MPSFHVYGIHAFLELRDLPSNPNTVASRVMESPPTLKWSPMQGMTHPISTTTVFSPAKSTSLPPIPFCIVVEFSPDSPPPANRHLLSSTNYLKGDARIEVKIDGIVRGWKILPQAKIWPKGVRIEFSGSRVGRTEERAFVFNPLPKSGNNEARVLLTPTPTPQVHAAGLPPLLEPRDSTLTPFAPSDLPLNSSHIEILITLGKKHNTLEKYLIFSPVLQEAFYIPPNLISPPFKESEGSASVDNNGVKRKAGPLLRTKKEAKASALLGPSYPSIIAANEGQQKLAGWHNSDTEVNFIEWRPVGLAGKSQKTAQMREAEFTARIHLARFWFIIALAPEPGHIIAQPRGSVLLNSLAPFDEQQDTRSDDNFIYSKGRKTQDTLDKNRLVKLEDSDISGEGDRGNAHQNMRNSGISDFFPDSLLTQEAESKNRNQTLEIYNSRLPPDIPAGAQYQRGLDPISKIQPSARNTRNGREIYKESEILPDEFSSSGKSTKSASGQTDSKDFDRSRWGKKGLKTENGLRGNQPGDTQKSNANKLMNSLAPVSAEGNV